MKIIYSKLLCGLCGLLCAGLGIVVLIGWHTGNASLVRSQPGFMPVQYLTALCFLLSGAGLASFALRLPRFLPIFLGALTGALGVLMCTAHLTGCSMGFTALLRHLPGIAGVTANISPAPTAAGLALAGAGVLLMELPVGMGIRRLLFWMLGASAGAVGLTVFWAYSLGATMVFMSGSPVGMAIHSSCGLMVLGAGLLCARWPGLRRLVDYRWLPAPFGVAAIVGTLTLWQELRADRRHTLGNQAAAAAGNAAAGTLDRFTYCVRSLNRIRDRWEESAVRPHPWLIRDALACLGDEPFFEAIGHADAGLKVDWAEADREADSWLGRSLRGHPQWDAGPALEDSIKNRRMLVSAIHPVRKNDEGLMIFLPMFSGNEFQGGIFGVLRLQDLERVLLEQPAFSSSRISIFEGDRLIRGDPPAKPGVKAESKLEFRGRVWRFVAEPESILPGGGEISTMILWMGVLLGGVTAGAVRGFQQTVLRGRMAWDANDRLRAQIAERHLAERRLRESEERLGQVLDSATGVSVIAFGGDGKITYFSRGAERLLGYSAQEAEGGPGISLLHDPVELSARGKALTEELGYGVEGMRILTEVPELKGNERREWTYLRRNGDRLSVDLTVTVRQDTDGAVTGYLATAVDITDRKEMERELRATVRAQRKSQALLEAASRIARLGYWELPLDGGGPVWSDMTYSIHELPAGTPVSLAQALDFYHPEDRPAIGDYSAEALRKDTPHEFEARLITATGRQLWVHSRRESVRDENGTVIAIQGILQDIDERRTAADLLRRRNAELEAATALAESHNRAKTQFLANMSHEIRTPLNAVIGMAGLLMDSRLAPREREFAETIHSSGELLLGIISDILDFSKIESGGVELERVPVDPRSLAGSVLDLLAGQAAKKRLELVCWTDPLLPAAIMGDPSRLRQILVILTSNAVKFTKRGEVVIKLWLGGEENGQWLHGSVSDTGIGIPADRMDRIFGVFSQVDMSNTRSFGGIGLGLAITHRLIRAMDGRIHVESEVGKGSIFRFALPMQPAPSSLPAPQPETLKGLRVLIVDDNDASRWILREHAALWGMVPSVAGEALLALELVREGGIFDLAVIDAEMPGMDGFALVEEIRRRGSAGGFPIVMLTSLDALARRPETPAVAASVTKPVRADALFHALCGIVAPVPALRRDSGIGGGAPPELPSGLSILVAEDNPVNRKVAALHLQRMGYEPVLVSNGLEALHAVRERRFDVILMDIQMPVMDGLESVREIRRTLPPEGAPWVIAVTANAFESDREVCLAAGMNDYLSKPLRSDSLKQALRLACGGGLRTDAETRQT